MRNIKGGLNDFQEVYPDDRLRWLTVNQITGVGPLWHSWSGSPLARRLRPLIQLPARRGDAGPEAHHPRRTISSSTQNPQRRRASGRVSCCPYRRLFRGDGRDTNARTASFLKQCHSPLALRQTISQWARLGLPSIGSEYTALPKGAAEQPATACAAPLSLFAKEHDTADSTRKKLALTRESGESLRRPIAVVLAYEEPRCPASGFQRWALQRRSWHSPAVLHDMPQSTPDNAQCRLRSRSGPVPGEMPRRARACLSSGAVAQQASHSVSADAVIAPCIPSASGLALRCR
jgi:hypothetical protein